MEWLKVFINNSLIVNVEKLEVCLNLLMVNGFFSSNILNSMSLLYWFYLLFYWRFVYKLWNEMYKKRGMIKMFVW